MKRINLIPPQRLERRTVALRTATWARRALGLLLLFVGAQVALGFQTHRRSAEVRELTREFTMLRDSLRAAERMIEERDRLAMRRATIENIEHGTLASGALEAISETLPPSSYLSFFSMATERTREGGTDDDAPVRLVLRGVAESHADVGALIGGLRSSQRFDGVTLVDTREESSESGDRRVIFEMTCRIQEPSDG